MFELLDGRPSAYQWDTGLYIDCTGLAESDEVHFCRPGITLALHPAMQGEKLAAPVPDELLQQAQPIIVSAYVQTATGEITRASTRLCVIARPKPPGYIASPTDALRWENLQEQIGDLADLNTQDKTNLVAAVNEAMTQGGAADPEAVQQIVENYLAENPPTVAETDPTVPEWAKAAQKPSYTAFEVGADPSGTAASQVSAHNTGTDTHSDIRLLISGLTDRLNALADSDDTTLDQLSEVVAYIKSNRELIAAITTDKVSVADIVDNLTTNVANKPLSAAQGVALKALIDAISIPDKLPNPNALTFTGAVTGSYDGSEPLSVNIPSGGGAAGDYIPIPASAKVGQTIRVKAVDSAGRPTEWEAADMAGGGGGVEIDISRQPDLILEVSEQVVSLSISEINGEPINTTEMVVLWEHPGGAKYVPAYFRFNNEVKNATDASATIANFNLPDSVCPSSTTAAAILCRVKKINNGTYWFEFNGLQQNVGTIVGTYTAVYGAPYRNNLIGETSIKEFYVYQSSNIQQGCKVSVWVK